jgi:hypothetical protein
VVARRGALAVADPEGVSGAAELVDRAGERYVYSVPLRRGALYSLGVGFVSSFLGIGGGVIHVPLLVRALGFPTHLATATSHFVLAIMAGAGTRAPDCWPMDLAGCDSSAAGWPAVGAAGGDQATNGVDEDGKAGLWHLASGFYGAVPRAGRPD